MNVSNHCAWLRITMAFLALGVAILCTGAPAQDQGWQIVRTDYGFAEQRIDVTNLLLGLLSRNATNVGTAVNNQTMGGDPAPGKDKSLHIIATDNQDQQREFDCKEGG